jgi:hypothetical protein
MTGRSNTLRRRRTEWLTDQQYQTAKETMALIKLQSAIAKDSQNLIQQQAETAKCTKEATEGAKGASVASLVSPTILSLNAGLQVANKVKLLTSIQATVAISAIRGPLVANPHLEIVALLSISLVLFLLLWVLVHQERCVNGARQVYLWLGGMRGELRTSLKSPC